MIFTIHLEWYKGFVSARVAATGLRAKFCIYTYQSPSLTVPAFNPSIPSALTMQLFSVAFFVSAVAAIAVRQTDPPQCAISCLTTTNTGSYRIVSFSPP